MPVSSLILQGWGQHERLMTGGYNDGTPFAGLVNQGYGQGGRWITQYYSSAAVPPAPTFTRKPGQKVGTRSHGGAF